MMLLAEADYMGNLATTVGVICGAVGTLVGGLLTLWWTKGTESRVRLIKAESDAKHRSQTEVIVHKQEEIDRQNAVISSYERRIVKLETDYESLRQLGHDERNKWYEERLKCAAETAELKGQVVTLQHQFDLLTTKATSQPASQPNP